MPTLQGDQLTFGVEVASGRCTGAKVPTRCLRVLYLLSTTHRAPQPPTETKKIGRFIKIQNAKPNVKARAWPKWETSASKFGRLTHPEDHSLNCKTARSRVSIYLPPPSERVQEILGSPPPAGLHATAPRAGGTRYWPGPLPPLTIFTQGHIHSQHSGATWLCVLMWYPAVKAQVFTKGPHTASEKPQELKSFRGRQLFRKLETWTVLFFSQCIGPEMHTSS